MEFSFVTNPCPKQEVLFAILVSHRPRSIFIILDLVGLNKMERTMRIHIADSNLFVIGVVFIG